MFVQKLAKCFCWGSRKLTQELRPRLQAPLPSVARSRLNDEWESAMSMQKLYIKLVWHRIVVLAIIHCCLRAVNLSSTCGRRRRWASAGATLRERIQNRLLCLSNKAANRTRIFGLTNALR
eukprot:2825108-Amphidinium_carterae.3